MTDDTLVADFLVCLKQSQAASSSPKSSPRAVIPLRWGLRQPRSRPVPFRCDALPRRKEADSRRCSPTTPLSWSGGGSPSATADGFEESNVHTSSYFAPLRSKVLSLFLLFFYSYSSPLPRPFVSYFGCWLPDLYRVILDLFNENTLGERVDLRLSGGARGCGVVACPSTMHSSSLEGIYGSFTNLTLFLVFFTRCILSASKSMLPFAHPAVVFFSRLTKIPRVKNKVRFANITALVSLYKE